MSPATVANNYYNYSSPAYHDCPTPYYLPPGHAVTTFIGNSELSGGPAKSRILGRIAIACPV